MSLGGYLYAGCSVQKSDFTDLTDKQWALALHKCRVKAFLDSLSRSGASWLVSRSDGQIDLDDNHKKCIYTLSTNNSNDTYQGYATYFKHTDSGETAYYLILTAPRWKANLSTGSSEDEHDGIDIYIDNILATNTYNTSSSGYYGMSYCSGATCFHALSLEDFGTHPMNIGYIPNKSTRLTTVGSKTSYSERTDASRWRSVLSNTGYMSSSNVSFGYCTKNKSADIESFAKSNNSSLGQWHAAVLSPKCITQLVSSTDTCKLALFNVRSNYNSNTSTTTHSESEDPNGDVSSGACQFLRSDGVLPSGVYSNKGFGLANMDVLYNAIPYGTLNSNRVYSAFCLYTSNPSGNDSNAKGYMNVELVSFSLQESSLWSTVSSGSYICANISNESMSLPRLISTNNKEILYTYIGWDASNPSMLGTAACPIYIPTVD